MVMATIKSDASSSCFEIRIDPLRRFVRITLDAVVVTEAIRAAFSCEAIVLGRAENIDRFLLDVRKAPRGPDQGSSGPYMSQARLILSSGLRSTDASAVLIAPDGTREHLNAPYYSGCRPRRMFEDESAAIDWLTGEEPRELVGLRFELDPGGDVIRSRFKPGVFSQMMRYEHIAELVQRARLHQVHRFLVDARGTVDMNGPMSATRADELAEIGFDQSCAMAMIVDPTDSTRSAHEASMRNNGYTYRIFTDPEVALTWLRSLRLPGDLAGGAAQVLGCLDSVEAASQTRMPL